MSSMSIAVEVREKDRLMKHKTKGFSSLKGTGQGVADVRAMLAQLHCCARLRCLFSRAFVHTFNFISFRMLQTKSRCYEKDSGRGEGVRILANDRPNGQPTEFLLFHRQPVGVLHAFGWINAGVHGRKIY